jgi:hypothetical protein
MIGVILAGGEATRLPNKPLLPIQCRRMLIESSIDFLKRHDCSKICAVVPNNGVLEAVLDHSITTIPQAVALGVAHAISLAAEHVPDGDCALVVFCDNMYDEVHDLLPENKAVPHAAVRNILGPSAGLDGWDGLCWAHRTLASSYKIAGWYLLPKRCMTCWDDQSMTSVQFLNRIDARPAFRPAAGWRDLGTVESYREYLLSTQLT